MCKLWVGRFTYMNILFEIWSNYGLNEKKNFEHVNKAKFSWTDLALNDMIVYKFNT